MRVGQSGARTEETGYKATFYEQDHAQGKYYSC